MYVDQLRWGDAADCGRQENGWDWLIESIEISRVYATIENFPVFDTILPYCCAPGEAVEVEPNEGERIEKQRDDSRRYSPGFLLPLILAALNDDAEFQSSSILLVQPLQTPPLERMLGPLFLQRLYEKGAIALAIASLSCKCLSIRKISLAILGLFTTALNRQDARNSVSWHYRPQIGMLLNSVQRSLILRFCDANKHNAPDLVDDVPQLPGFSSVFLARASIILSHPADPLYTSINRAFLRSEEDAGAFQDLTRLPVFVALFCSSAETPEQLSAERRFALNLVQEGFTEVGNYKMLTQCHCPELMLTSIDFALVRSSFGFDDDLQILFGTLTHMIVSGDDRLAAHIINRLGLFAWARALMVGKYSFPNIHVYVAFLKMLNALFNLGSRHENVVSRSDIVAASRGMAQCVLNIAIEQPYNGQTKNRSRTSVDLVLSHTCEILLLLSQAQRATNVDTPDKDDFQIHCQPDGIVLDAAVRFVDELRLHPHYIPKVVVAVCTLPIKFYPADISSLKHLCTILVDTHKSLQNESNASKLAIFRRLCFITQSIVSVVDVTADVLQCLILWRSQCTSCSTLRQVWYEIIKTLVPFDSDRKVDFRMCTKDNYLLPLYILQNETSIKL